MVEFADVDDGADRHAGLAAVAQRRQRVGRLARLRDEEGSALLRDRHLAVAEFGGDIDVDRQARVTLEPVFADQPGEIGRAAGRDRDAVEFGEIERQVERLRRAAGEVEIVGERVADHLRLLMDLLLHEMPVVALVDHEGGAERLLALALDLAAVHVEDGDLVAAHDRPVAVLEIGDRIGEGRQRNGVRAQEHLAFAMADGERRAVAGADDQILVAGEHDGEREGALQPLQRIVGGLDGLCATREFARDEMGDHLGVGLRGEFVAVALQLLAQLGEILDDAVVDDGDAVRRNADARWSRWARRGSPSACGRCRSCRRAARSFSRRSRLISLPSARRRASSPRSMVATPAES